MRLFEKMRKINNNRGLSLVELIVAIALFAIIVTPVMNTFISSAKVNRNARKLMIANDVAQTIMEGYSEKTYETLITCLGFTTSTDLQGTSAFTTTNGNVYNISSNWVDLSSNLTFDSKFSNISIESITYLDGAIPLTSPTIDMISSNAITDVMNRDFSSLIVPTVSGQQVYYFVKNATDASGVVDSENGIIMMAYTNVAADTGYTFNAIVTIFPTGFTGNKSTTHYTTYNVAKNYYMPYNIKLTLYDATNIATPADPSVPAATDFGQPMLTLLGGISNK